MLILTHTETQPLSLSLSLFMSLSPLPPLLQGTVYEKTNAEVEMKKINREEFWEQAKVGVEQRRKEGVSGGKLRWMNKGKHGGKEREQLNPPSLVQKSKVEGKA